MGSREIRKWFSRQRQAVVNNLYLFGQDLARGMEEMFDRTTGSEIKVKFFRIEPVVKKAAGHKRKFNQLIFELEDFSSAPLQSIQDAVQKFVSQAQLPEDTLVKFVYRKEKRQ